ncbi:hypothetical protein SAMN05421659_12246 [[Clostridium] fimetarium]|uniref:Uncharacterized protein n=1 Tax=[Clostridium] fimetarium TaxID=99656 RepID=A0A1I0RST4_9FIRM|nr:hypothetical protein SAMN05421659_12246 [[Clostridium] fimetarium]
MEYNIREMESFEYPLLDVFYTKLYFNVMK